MQQSLLEKQINKSESGTVATTATTWGVGDMRTITFTAGSVFCSPGLGDYGGLRHPGVRSGQNGPALTPELHSSTAPATFNNNWLSAASSQRWLQTPAPLSPPTHAGVVLYSRWASTRPRAVGSAPFTLPFPFLRDVSIPGSSG